MGVSTNLPAQSHLLTFASTCAKHIFFFLIQMPLGCNCYTTSFLSVMLQQVLFSKGQLQQDCQYYSLLQCDLDILTLSSAVSIFSPCTWTSQHQDEAQVTLYDLCGFIRKRSEVSSLLEGMCTREDGIILRLFNHHSSEKISHSVAPVRPQLPGPTFKGVKKAPADEQSQFHYQ